MVNRRVSSIMVMVVVIGMLIVVGQQPGAGQPGPARMLDDRGDAIAQGVSERRARTDRPSISVPFPVLPAPAPPPTTTTVPAPPEERRDPLDRPFRWDSPWNLPIGDGARYLPAGMVPPGNGYGVDEDVIILEADAPLQQINRTSVGWTRDMTRCEGLIAGTYQLGGDLVPIPAGFTTEGLYLGLTPNHAAAILMPDGRTIRQTQPFHRCTDGRAVSRADYPDADIVSGDGIEGAHGGSGMSSLGGSIRLDDIERGGIDHAIKLTIEAARYLNRDEGGYRWPAVKADGYVDAPTTARCHYGGTDPAFRMGSLLALRPDFDVDALETEFARMVAEAFVSHGGYVVDDSCWDTFLIATEWGPDGRVLDAVRDRYGIDIETSERPGCSASTPDCRYVRDMGVIVSALHIVDNNTAAAPGGPGERIAPCAPPFTDGTGAPPPGSVCG